ncbi:hypothetical protein B2J93_4415 [Marssonina coronariae]|uniref:SGNH hydrolase-type esterase domain-containing protein n=1 Tax=Diplocarpon coronariae TaxID=2795749 RepID=A0A218Z9Y7_9HELO|nr:hypothetical protein B2J93_4415 [Marssonina coronariae]
MKSFCYVLLSALAATVAIAAPADVIEGRETIAAPTLYLAGDSTMAKARDGSPTTGWGPFLPYSMKDISVVNLAIGGRSARSYTEEGRFKTLIEKLLPGDYVVMSFGHNDGGGLSKTDNGRSACAGSGSETCTTPEGKIVQTYVTYLTNAAKEMVAKGATVIVSSPTPKNICNSGTCSYTPPRWVEYSQKVVANTGPKASFVDHGLYVANEYLKLGKAKVDTFYPVDYTHPNADGSTLIAGLFVKAVLCSNNVLAPFIKNATDTVPGACV